MIWVLPENHHLDGIERAKVKCPEDLAPGRVYDYPAVLFLVQFPCKFAEILLVPFRAQSLAPAFFDFDVHTSANLTKYDFPVTIMPYI